MAFLAGPDRTQTVLLPEVLDDYVPADSPVRFLSGTSTARSRAICGSWSVRAAQTVLEAPAPVVVADQGSYHGAEIQTCLEAGITPLVPRPLTSANEARGLFTKDDFRYDRARDVYHCPAGATLTDRSTTVESGRPIKHYRTSACGRCALRARCTRNQDGRKLTRWVHEDLLDDMLDRRSRHKPQGGILRRGPCAGRNAWWIRPFPMSSNGVSSVNHERRSCDEARRR